MDTLKFGQSLVEIPPTFLNQATWLKPRAESAPLSDAHEAIAAALRNPTGSPPLSKLIKQGEKVAVIVSDITRPVPTHVLLPPLLEELHRSGIETGDIQIVFGLGIHRPMTEEEKVQALGRDIFAKYKTIDPKEFILLGRTSRGTPIEVCREVADADFVIPTGNLEFHYFAGYSGGYKALMPGVSTKAAIENNHKMMLDPAAAIGVADGNPVREDIEEFGRKFPRTFLLNVLLNSRKEITKVVAGDPVLAHREGCNFLDQYYKIVVEEPADLVIVSPGGYPKDINLYQAQKALENAAKVAKKGGRILLVAELKDGFGEDTFEDWLVNCHSIEDIILKIKERFVLGGHKAAAIAKVLQEQEVLLLSSLDTELVRKIFFTPVTKISDISIANNESIYIIPYGNQTLPEVRQKQAMNIAL